MRHRQSIKDNPAYTACNVLDAFADNLYDRVIPAKLVPSFRVVASLFPPVSGIGIEYHLNGMPRADLSIRISGYDSTREQLLSFADTHGQSVFNQAEWEPLLAFHKEWCDASSRLYHTIDTVWLEFDMNTNGTYEKLPAVFFNVANGGSHHKGTPIAALDRALELLECPLKDTAEALLIKLLACNASLQLHYCGLKTNRKGSALRVCLLVTSPSQLFSCLDGMAENTMSTNNRERLWLLARHAGRLILNLDISDRVHDSIGVEVYFNSMDQWKDFFADMAGLSLCSDHEAAETLSFPGVCCFNDENFRRHASAMAQKEVHYLERRLNHVKINVSEQSGLTAKAYLYACYH